MLLEVKNLAVTYGTNSPIVEQVNFMVDRGEILAIVGESGSGKTTVIRAIQGSLPLGGRVTTGDILFQGENLVAKTREKIRELSGNGLSMIFQDTGSMLNPIRTIGSQFVDYIQNHSELSKEEAIAKAQAMLLAVNLAAVENIMHSYPFELSGGMRQRVGIAMAMTFQPKLLLADEPTSALDVTTQAQIVQQMVEVRNKLGVAIIIVTHNLGVAAYMANKIMVMKDGKVVEQGEAEQVLHCPTHAYTKKLLRAVPEIGGRRYG